MGYNMRYIALFAILIGCLASLVLLKTYPMVDITMEQGPNDTPSAETIADTIIMPCFVAISSGHLYHVIGTNIIAHVCANFNFSLNLLHCALPHDRFMRQLSFWHKESTPRLCAIIQVYRNFHYHLQDIFQLSW
jgi:hypothetical protein